MSIEFQDETPSACKKEKIIVDGEHIGSVQQYERSGSQELCYHAWIKFEGPGMLCNSLIQGHGITKIDAIKEAIVSGRIEAMAVLNCIAALEKKI